MKRSKILGFAVGPVGAAVLGAVSLPVSTWMFGAADIGRIAMLQTVTSLAIIVFGLGLDQSYLREYHQAKDGRALFRMAIGPGLLLLALGAAAALALDPQGLARAVVGVDSAGLAGVIVLTIATAFCSRYFSLILRMEERGLAFSMSQLLPKLIFLGILLFIYLAGGERGLPQLLSAHVAGIVAAMLIFAFNTRHVWLGRAAAGGNVFGAGDLLRYGMPLMVSGLAFWGVEALDKVSLRFLSSFTELGNYSIAVGIASVAGTLSVLFTTIWIPTAYRWADEPDCGPRIEAVAHKLVALGSTLIALAGAFSWTLRFLLPAHYGAVQYLLCACMVPPVLYATAEVSGIGAGIVRKNVPVMFSALLAGAINLGGNLLLVPPLGATGAAVSTAIAFFAMLVMRSEISMRAWAPMRRSKLYLPLGVITLVSVLFALSGEQFSVFWTCAWQLVAIACLVLNRSVLAELGAGLRRGRKPAAPPVQQTAAAQTD
ncbi:lipopolysaccharide biosynthesis protein [Massilia sp. AB1]|uniref:lipopolysaccharide biosynthesis protein n=1 Tax=Massilia sp. AB1 TaxID=2823371 RepID=UPI001B80FDB3|nr:lipopolysaccharide biosynthesis protein [Massilia sp. AB1]MBQ5939639.1 lipopolysaccharide biosynthesis protein [Massilia sp. AB1]